MFRHTIHRLPSNVYRLSSVVCRLPSIVSVSIHADFTGIGQIDCGLNTSTLTLFNLGKLGGRMSKLDFEHYL